MAGVVVVEVTVTVLDSRQRAAGPDFISPSNPEDLLLPALTETALVKYVLPNSLPSFLYLLKGESPTHFRKQPLQQPEGSLENIKSKPLLLCTPF